MTMAHIERRQIQEPMPSGRVKLVTRYRVRYRDRNGVQHAETKKRMIDAERRKAEIEMELATDLWRDPRRGDVRFQDWAEQWLPTRHDLRATTFARLKLTMAKQVLPRFGSTQLNRITNSDVRAWLTSLLTDGYSAATARKAVFALRQCLAAAVEDGRMATNPALSVPLPAERQKPPRYLSQSEVERLVAQMPAEYAALILVGAYAGLRWGEAVGLRRCDIDTGRSRIVVTQTAVEVNGKVTLGNQPKTTRSKRSVPVARLVMRRIVVHLDLFVKPQGDALLFTSPSGGPLFRAFGNRVLRPAVLAADLDDITFHGLRHSFVAIMVAAGCNVREVSEWAGHNSVAFTLTRYGGLFDDGSDAAIDRLDALLSKETPRDR
jgi:integrase